MTAVQDLKDVEAIKALIRSFFDAINASDPKALQALCAPKTNLTIIRQDPPRPPPAHSRWAELPQAQVRVSKVVEKDEKITVVLRCDIETFVKLIEDGNKRRHGRLPEIHEAADLEATDIKVDELFASAWSPFRVTFDGVLHHFGTFVYTFGRVDGSWVFEGLTQNYRRTPGWEEVGHGAENGQRALLA